MLCKKKKKKRGGSRCKRVQEKKRKKEFWLETTFDIYYSTVKPGNQYIV